MLGYRNREFEFRSRHWCLSSLSVLPCPVVVEALRRADPSPVSLTECQKRQGIDRNFKMRSFSKNRIATGKEKVRPLPHLASRRWVML
jgi:hypothetical protein